MLLFKCLNWLLNAKTKLHTIELCQHPCHVKKKENNNKIKVTNHTELIFKMNKAYVNILNET